MEIEIKTDQKKSLLDIVAASLGIPVQDNIIHIPEEMGSGFIKGCMVNESLQITARHFELNTAWQIKRSIDRDEDFVIIVFKDVLRTSSNKSERKLPSVYITVPRFENELVIPARTTINSIYITVRTSYLTELITKTKGNQVTEIITSSNKAFLFETLISSEIQMVADELLNATINKQLEHFFYRLKAEQLIFLLFNELLKRENVAPQALNTRDINAIFNVKEKIISSPTVPPCLSDLALSANISETKLKRLFKHIYGTSIYSYYQTVRMQEAATLLKEKKMSVSEVGYHLGFTNLSHFSRLFEQYIGMKPKKYSNNKSV